MNSINQCRPALGTYIEISLVGEADDDALLESSLFAFAEIARIEKLMSFHDKNSELSEVNRTAHLERCPISSDLETVLSFALSLSKITNGRYDISIARELVKRGELPDHGLASDEDASWKDIELGSGSVRFHRPMQLHLGGIAKGYAVDRAIESLDANVKGVVNAGGDLRMTHWEGESVGIKVPSEKKQLGVIKTEMLAASLATSGSYYLEGSPVIFSFDSNQMIDPSQSVSVFAPSCMTADALTKVVFLDPDPLPILQACGAQAIVADSSGFINSLEVKKCPE